jgi:enhancing lycopene biosynthesis protein 2
MKKFAVLLSGCGFKDGAEITESISTLIALSEANAEYRVFAPSGEFESVNHATNQPGEKRQMLAEAARIARGEIFDLKTLKASDFDGLILPGGYGAAKNLCLFATHGAKAVVLPEVKNVIETFHAADKPIGAFCIAPAVVALVLGNKGVTLTIGNDKETAKEIEKTGAQHAECDVEDFITDRENKVVTTPAYMYNAKPHQVFTGIRRAVREIVEMA